MWYLIRGVILTKDNLAKRSWQGSQKCVFCDSNESIQHLFFFKYHYARFFWRLLYCCFVLCTRDQLNIFLDLGCMGCNLKLKIWLSHVLQRYVGLFGYVGMTYCLIITWSLLFLRFFFGQNIGLGSRDFCIGITGPAFFAECLIHSTNALYTRQDHYTTIRGLTGKFPFANRSSFSSMLLMNAEIFLTLNEISIISLKSTLSNSWIVVPYIGRKDTR